MTKRLTQIRQRTNTVQISWILNNICTNHCDYCPPALHNGANHHYEWSHAKSFTERLLARYSQMNVSISGGEPTLSPHFPELVDMFHRAGHTVGITTNGARSVSWWEEMAPRLSYICFSYHPQYPDAKFLDKVLAAAKYTQCTIRVTMDAVRWEQSVEFFNLAAKHTNIRVEPVRLLDEIANRQVESTKYTPEQEQWLLTTPPTIYSELDLSKNPNWKMANIGSEFYWDDGSSDKFGDTNQLLLNNQTDFRGWSCNIGLESLVITWEGDVKKGNCLQGGILFNLSNHQQHELPSSAEICFQPMCYCGTDILISKVPLVPPDHPIVIQYMEPSMIKTQEDYQHLYRKFIKIKPQ